MNHPTSHLLASSLVADDRAAADRTRRARGIDPATDGSAARESVARALVAFLRGIGTIASRMMRGAAVD
jgi:hypothetical protein